MLENGNGKGSRKIVTYAAAEVVSSDRRFFLPYGALLCYHEIMKSAQTVPHRSAKRRKETDREVVLRRMPRRQSLFWDVDPKKVDPKKHAIYVIERILDFGTDDEVRWMWKAYSSRALRNVVRRSRILRPSTRALWELMTATK